MKNENEINNEINCGQCITSLSDGYILIGMLYL